MSLSLPEARDRLARDEVLKQGMGEEFIETWGRVNKVHHSLCGFGPHKYRAD